MCENCGHPLQSHVLSYGGYVLLFPMCIVKDCECELKISLKEMQDLGILEGEL